MGFAFLDEPMELEQASFYNITINETDKKLIKKFEYFNAGINSFWVMELIDDITIKIFPNKKIPELPNENGVVEIYIHFEHIDGEFNCEKKFARMYFISLEEMCYQLPFFMQREKILSESQMAILHDFFIKKIINFGGNK